MDAIRGLAGPGKLGFAADLSRYLERMAARACELCRGRWFSPTSDFPYWAESRE